MSAVVSVVVPFFNPGEFLRQAINSVVAQTYSYWELILVDDGSTDASPAIAKCFASHYPGRIFYLQHSDLRNHGMAASRLLGISASSGKYIANLDADDIFMPAKLSIQVDILERHPEVSLTFSPMLLWSSWDGGFDEVQSFQFNTPQIISPPNYLKYLLNRKNDPHGYLVRANTLKSRAEYEIVPTICEDWTFYFKLMLFESVYVADTPLYCYRIHPQQSCAQLVHSGVFYLSFLPFYHWLFRYLLSIRNVSFKVFQVVIREYVNTLVLVARQSARYLVKKLLRF